MKGYLKGALLVGGSLAAGGLVYFIVKIDKEFETLKEKHRHEEKMLELELKLKKEEESK